MRSGTLIDRKSKCKTNNSSGARTRRKVLREQTGERCERRESEASAHSSVCSCSSHNAFMEAHQFTQYSNEESLQELTILALGKNFLKELETFWYCYSVGGARGATYDQIALKFSKLLFFFKGTVY